MKKFALLSIVMTPLLAGCGAMIGTTGQNTSFEREGTLNCAGTDVETQDLVVGTVSNPVRCGPQSQPIPR